MTFPQSWSSCAYPIVLYHAVNQINGKRYIGITKTGLAKRASRHFRTARLFKSGAIIGAAIRKYKQRNIKFSVLAVCPTWDYAKNLEVAAIAAFKPEYNATKGGDGAVGYRHTEEHKARMAELHRGKQFFLGKKHTPEAKEKMRQSRLAGIGGPVTGKSLNLSPEQRAARSLNAIKYKPWLSRKRQDNSPHLNGKE